jgi:BirA family biotin operon repressor/biotin-[acetyl-CoA-carboxylase] ligase
VRADYQTAGRGKLERKWLMPPKQGVLLSIILREMPPGVQLMQLTLQVGWKLANRLRQITGLQIGIKEPNDLMVGGKKIAGILSEARWRGDEFLFAVVGVGINVNVMEFPEEIRETATSLALAAGREFDLDAVAQAVIEELRGL